MVIIMLVFTVKMSVQAGKWTDENQKQVFMKNAEDVVNRGLMLATVPDWMAEVVDVHEEGD